MPTETMAKALAEGKKATAAGANSFALGVLEAALLLLLALVVALAIGFADAAAARRGDADLGLRAFSRRGDTDHADSGLRVLALVAEVAQRNIPPFRDGAGTVALLAGFGAVLAVLVGLVHRARIRGAIALGQAVAKQYRRQIHRHCFRLGQSALPSSGLSQLQELFERDVESVREATTTWRASNPRDPVLIAGLLALAFAVSPVAAAFLAALGGAASWSIGRLRSRGRSIERRSAREARFQRDLLAEDLALVRTVRAFSLERLDQRRFEEHLDNLSEAEGQRLRSRASARLATSAATAIAAGLGLAGLLVGVAVTGRVSPTQAAIVVACLTAVAALWSRWLTARHVAADAEPALEAITEYLGRRSELLQTVGAEFLQPLQANIKLDHIILNGEDGRPLLDNVSVEFLAGVRNAVLSNEEASAAALLSLIPRLIDPNKGRVLFDGRDLRDVTLDSLRAQIGVVFQNDLAFTDTVANNIGLGAPGVPFARVVEAAKVARAHSFIRKLPQGYDTVIGPLGHGLAPDELYRIALARVYLHDPSVVILEEPNARLEDEAKFVIDDALARVEVGRTVIFLPDRLSTLRSCQRIVVLREGKVEAVGSHKELQANSKLYRHIQYVRYNPFAQGEGEPE